MLSENPKPLYHNKQIHWFTEFDAMMRFSTLFFVFVIFAVKALGQASVPKPAPNPPDDKDVVKISTNLIQVDVTVVDSKGRVVNDLKPGEIEIYENGQKQNITNFSFISSVRAATGKKAVVEKDAIPIPQHMLRPEQVRRTIVLVVDDLRLSFASAAYTRKALNKFVDEQMQDGDLVAVIRTGGGIGTLQQFSTHKQMLHAAIDRVRWTPFGNNGAGVFDPSAHVDVMGGGISATVSINAVRDVVEGMTGLPGRKSILLFSDGFSLLEFDKNGMTQGGWVNDALTKLIDAANRSSVVIYTVDSRGLAITAPMAADQIDSPMRIRTIMMNRNRQLVENQSGLSFLARGTGGFDIKNTNDLGSGIRKILDDQSYYRVGYEPNPETFQRGKIKFNTLEVRVTRTGTHARYRGGFMNVTKAEMDAVTSPDGVPAQEFANALTSPFGAQGISVRLNALFENQEKIGSYLRSLLHINAKDVKFTDEPDGSRKAELAVLAASFGDNGLPVQQIRRVYTLNVRGKTYDKIMAEGFVYQFAFPVKDPGGYQYRVAIRDMQSGKIGSAGQFIQVPMFTKENLLLSGLALDSLTADQWRQASLPDGAYVSADPMTSTALRQIKAGTVLSYGFEVYGATAGESKQPNLQKRVRVFSDGKLILDGPPSPIDTGGQTDMQRIKVAGAVALGNQMLPGDYILQVIVIDILAKTKNQIATQFVEFEVVE